MKRIETIPYTIGTQFAALIANGDATGLTGDEDDSFSAFETAARLDAPHGYAFSHWAIDTDDYDEFARCEITGLHGACYRVDAVYFHNKA